MYDDEKKFSKRHWYGLLFLMIILGLFALSQGFNQSNDIEPATTTSTQEIYPEFGMMFDASGNFGTLHEGRISGYFNGDVVRRMPVQYVEVDGYAVYEGDVLLHLDGPVQAGMGINDTGYRWPNNLIPYEIDPKLADPQRIADAIAHWEAHTPIRFVERTSANASQYPNWVKFVPSQGCASYVGMQGGMQPVMLAAACSTGNTIHEIGHAVGLWHEQSRIDRDEHVDILYENIISMYAYNFDRRTEDGEDLGDYDYGSIMHYPRWAFSKNGKDTIVPRGNHEIGQRDGLSAGDIGAVLEMYDSSDVLSNNADVELQDEAQDFNFQNESHHEGGCHRDGM